MNTCKHQFIERDQEVYKVINVRSNSEEGKMVATFEEPNMQIIKVGRSINSYNVEAKQD